MHRAWKTTFLIDFVICKNAKPAAIEDSDYAFQAGLSDHVPLLLSFDYSSLPPPREKPEKLIPSKILPEKVLNFILTNASPNLFVVRKFVHKNRWLKLKPLFKKAIRPESLLKALEILKTTKNSHAMTSYYLAEFESKIQEFSKIRAQDSKAAFKL